MKLSISQLLTRFEPIGDPFGTHVNLLRAIGSDAKWVLELGMGNYSTGTFLDRGWYPKLDFLCSIEHNAEWAKKCMSTDNRHRVIIATEPIEPWIDATDIKLSDFDLIFVDNSASGEMRCNTLRYVAANAGHALVVAHDWNVPSYAEAGAGFDNVIVDDRQEPWTALMWRNHA